MILKVFNFALLLSPNLVERSCLCLEQTNHKYASTFWFVKYVKINTFMYILKVEEGFLLNQINQVKVTVPPGKFKSTLTLEIILVAPFMVNSSNPTIC